MDKKLNLFNILDKIEDYFSPKIIGEVNDVYIKLAKINGDKIPWHNHENEDEMFYILDGSLLFEIENEPSFMMNTGDMFIVKKGINHRVTSTEECSVLLIENKLTKHTGSVKSEITKSIAQQKL
ncbi:MAG: cupin domain-containing protein [Lutibacter sp.]|uniref:cupin domain-containing protein n=1 Tax=Lutibacter sp. TaxID=1925666 RepID=UPI00299DF5C9|nr:cupin domain-containing protein [Lutibacter sp.]MDX1828670.1 cupin domain-containing protein [Lutibacter sp.]